jgi:ankyrin repeat protein
VANLLLCAGANPCTSDLDGVTALMHACHNDKLPFVQLLLSVGQQQDTDRKPKSSQAVPRRVDVDAVSKHGLTAIMLACDGGSDAIVQALLHAGVNLNQKNTMGMSALLLAVSFSRRS